MQPLPPVSSPELSAFVPLVRAFCNHFEAVETMGTIPFLTHAHTLVAQLYATALKLPSTDVLFPQSEAEEEDDDQPVPDFEADLDDGDHEEWARLYRSLGAKFGRWDTYREIFDPYDARIEPEVSGSLSDDLTDIYRELRSGLRKWDRGDTGGALWEWRFGLENHWGEHATGLLRALHALASKFETGWPASRTGAA